ncbi:MAG: hypothetical protein AB7G62_18520 [Magnetospirillum sp.]
MKAKLIAVLLTAISIGSAQGADQGKVDEADLAAKSAQMETLRARASIHPTAATTSTVIEADNLLRQLREAKPDKRAALRAQLEAALARLELEIDAAGRGK